MAVASEGSRIAGLVILPLGALCVWLELSRRRAYAELKAAKRMLEKVDGDRLAERRGRIKAEKGLRSNLLSAPAAGPSAAPVTPSAKGVVAYPLTPVGTLRSCFSQRNGTPRQPLLVPAARAEVVLRAGMPPDILEGITQYSHCWVLYIFHENTDLTRLWEPMGGKVKSKINVPRLNGGRMGVLATRSPHRPAPVGLSVARILGVRGGRLILEGADVVDGTPILDIKPYVPFCV